MKLYDFTYIDNQNLSDSDLQKRVIAFLINECELQGWHNDYSLKQVSATKNSDDSIHYSFQVFGKFIDSVSDEFVEVANDTKTDKSRMVASPTL
jgi:hypothetical protein